MADECRRQGVGSQLLGIVELYAAENGFNEIDLLVTASNQSAVNFYQKADYKPERYHMKKTIKKNAHTGENADA